MQILRRILKVRVMYEATLSLAIAWIVIWANRMRENPRVFPMWEQSKFLSYLYWRHVIIEPGTVLEQVFWSLLLGSLIVCAFRLLAKLQIVGYLLGTVGGVIAVLGFPLFYILGFSYSLTQPLLHISGIELLFAFMWLSVYYFLHKRMPLLLITIVILTFHFCFWAWLTHNYVNPASQLHAYAPWTAGFWISSLFYFGFPLFGVCSALLWAAFVRQSQTEAM